MYDLTLQALLFNTLSLAIIAAVDGFALALGASALGDPGPAQDGRLTLDPLAHVDLLGALGVAAFGLGWIKPLAVTPSALRGGALGSLALVLSGSLAVAVLGALVSLLLPVVALTLSNTAAPLAAAFIARFVSTSLAFSLVNLVPLPPLAGGYLLDAAWPAGAAFLRRYSVVVGLVLLALMATGQPGSIVGDIVRPLASALTHGS